MKRKNILWITVLLLGWLFDFLFWKQTPGINFAIYTVLCLAGGFLVIGLNGIKPAWKALLLLAPVGFFAAMTFIRQEPLSLFLSWAFTLGFLGVLASTYLGGRWFSYGIADYVVNSLRLAGSMIARPLMFIAEGRRQAATEKPGEEGTTDSSSQPRTTPKSGTKRFWAVFRGVLIAIPILAIFSTLLASADLVFAQRLDEFVKLFRLENLPEYIFRMVYILVGAYLLAGVFLHAATKSRDEKLVGEDKRLLPQFMGFTETTVVLGSVVVLFIIFVIIQFQYFFGGQANINVAGYTFAEYARRGFGELVAVAFISLLLFLGLSAITKRETKGQRQAFSGLGIGVVVLVGVMLVSAFQRLLLYEAAYGFTRLRIYTHIFMIWLGILLAAAIVLEILRRERFFALAALLTAVGFVVTLSLLNVDAFIVRQNVARAPDGKGLDVAYLASLSDDSVPTLVEEFQSNKLPGLTRDAIGAVLVCHERIYSGNPDRDWRSFNLAGWRSDRALAGMQDKLDQYKVVDEDWPVKLLTPGNVYYECQGSGMGD